MFARQTAAGPRTGLAMASDTRIGGSPAQRQPTTPQDSPASHPRPGKLDQSPPTATLVLGVNADRTYTDRSACGVTHLAPPLAALPTTIPARGLFPSITWPRSDLHEDRAEPGRLNPIGPG